MKKFKLTQDLSWLITGIVLISFLILLESFKFGIVWAIIIVVVGIAIGLGITLGAQYLISKLPEE